MGAKVVWQAFWTHMSSTGHLQITAVCWRIGVACNPLTAITMTACEVDKITYFSENNNPSDLCQAKITNSKLMEGFGLLYRHPVSLLQSQRGDNCHSDHAAIFWIVCRSIGPYGLVYCRYGVIASNCINTQAQLLQWTVGHMDGGILH